MQWLTGDRGDLAFYPYGSERPWLNLLICHGFAEHSGWWHHVAGALRKRGVSAYLFDHYHHGRSAGAPGDVGDYQDLAAGLRLVLKAGVGPLRAGAPVVVLGHSNGALVALYAMAGGSRLPVDGLALSSPFLGMPPRVAIFGTALAWLLRLANPRFRVPIASRPWRLTGHRAIWPQYRRDPYRFRQISVRFFFAMRRALAEARRVNRLPGLPLLMMTAGRELVVDPGSAQAWFEGVEAMDKERIAYPGMRHELFNESDWEKILADLVTWCRARFGSGSGEETGK